MKLILLGLDGAPPDLIKPWVEEGRLPAFKKLMEEGTWGDMKTTIPPMTCPAWPTMFTGLNPGKHGVFGFMESKRQGEVSIVRSSSIKGEALWDYLNKAGYKVGVAFVPLTYPPLEVDGFMISGLPSPDDFGPTYPQLLRKEMEREVGPLELNLHRLTKKYGFYEGYCRAAKVQFNLRRKLFYYLWDKDPDFMFFVFSCTDMIQHWLWHFMENQNSQFSESILEIYQMIDKFLGEIMELNKNLLVVSDHGFGPQPKMINLNNYLIKKGYLKLKRTPTTLVRKALFNVGVTPYRINQILKKLGGGDLERKLTRNKRNKILNNFFLSFKDVDWDKTTAYSKGHYGQIHFTSKNNRERLVDRLKKDLQGITDGNKEEIVDRIYSGADIYRGRYTNRGPDLVLKMRDYAITSFPLFSSDRKLIIDHARGTTGGHRENGLFIAWGSDIKALGELDGVRIEDVAPTVLYSYNLSIPERMDGRCLRKVFNSESEIILGSDNFSSAEEFNHEG